jgi:NADH-quinone oxidoreductase subunit N
LWVCGAPPPPHYYGLALIGVLNSAISLYYYIRIVVFMYVKKDTIGSEPRTTPALATALAIAVAATLVLGIYPRLLFQVADASARTLGAAAAIAALR